MNYRPASKPLGRIRQWLLYRLAGYQSETCQRCGRGYDEAWWCDSAEQWSAAYTEATGRSLGSSGLLCPRCFERAVGARGGRVFWTATVTCAIEAAREEAA